jgi:putative restriction endonuclease
MSIKYYEEELKNSKTNYFIFDTHGNSENDRGDEDFTKYQWETNRYNLVKEGDLFIYRRPSRSSENGAFYFFGAGKIENIQEIKDNLVEATISKQYSFCEDLLKEDLESFKWKWKDRGSNWSHFFNQYGMNKIKKEDFINLIKLSLDENNEDINLEDNEERINAAQRMEEGNYKGENKIAETEVRVGQNRFSKKVKTNYNYRCAICGIKIKGFLIGSHIIPWADNKDTRLDPRNGICLCALHDKAFDKGYLTIDNNYRVKLSKKVKKDEKLYDFLKDSEGKKIGTPIRKKPLEEYLEYHQNNIFIR